MSLAVLAQDMASKGRNGDSMLVHMTPGEVAGLQALAMKHGGELTINPDTGLPEANFLKSLLPIIAGFALGPAGFGLVSSGLGAAAAVGGITGLATGSLSKGLMAGLGAYGGFGLGESLMSAGAGSLAATDIAAQQAAGAFPTLAEGAGAEQILKYGNDVSALRDAALSKAGEAGFMKTAGAGFGAIADNPAAYGKDLFKYGMAAASPIMADAMVPTTTKVDPVDTGNIRKFSYDPYSQRYTPQGIFPAAGYKGGMAEGGIVALAGGGGLTAQQFKEQMYAGGLDDSAATKRGLEIAAQQGLNAQQTTDLWNEALGTKFTPNDYSRVAQQYGVAGPQANVDFVKGLATNDVTTPQFLAETTARGLTSQDVNAALLGSGLSKGAQFALTNQNIGSEANTAETYGGIKGLSNNINYWLQSHPGASAQDIRREMAKYDLTDQDFIRATGTDVNNYAMGPITKVQNLAGGVGGNTSAVVNENGTITQVALPTNVTGGQPTGTVDDIKKIYTQGGGSLGYTVNAPKTMEEFNQRFNTYRPGSDSESAYNYLMGKGAYPTKSNVGEIMKPYNEAVLGIPQDISTKKYLWDATSRKMVLNPDYVPMSFDTKGVQSFGLSQSDISKYLTANNKASDASIYSWAVANNVTPEQIAAANKGDLSTIRAKYNAAKVIANRYSTTDGTTGMPDDWDEAAYLAMYPDVAKELSTGKSVIYPDRPTTYTSGYEHWLQYGKNQGWKPTYKTAANGGLMGFADGGVTGSGQLNLNIPLNLGGNNNGYSAAGSGLGGMNADMASRLGAGMSNNVAQSGLPDFRSQIQGLDAKIQQLPSVMAYNDYGKSITGRPPTADEMAQMDKLRGAIQGDKGYTDLQSQMQSLGSKYQQQAMGNQSSGLQQRYIQQSPNVSSFAEGGYAMGGLGNLGGYSDGGRLLKGPGDGVSDSIPATIGRKQQPARLADGEFVIPARIVSELGNGSTDAGAKKLYAMMDRVQRARGKTTGKNKVAANSRADKYLPA